MTLAHVLSAAAQLSQLRTMEIRSGYLQDTTRRHHREPRIVDALRALGGVATLRSLTIAGVKWSDD
jgi:hypothetical protein